MNYNILFICSIIVPIFSLEKTTPKICVNCKFFKNDLIFDIASEKRYGKCLAFPIVTEENENDYNDFLVTGIKKNKIIEYSYCSIARRSEDMCGKGGKMYKSKKETLK